MNDSPSATAAASPDLSNGGAHLLYGHAGSITAARQFARLDGVFHLPQMADLIVVEPLGLLRLMNAGDGRIWQRRDGVEVYLDSSGRTLTLWPCVTA
ncbi:hypothetical protein F4561_004573 [Lipingzhangella halophila]|uniref:Uncharacterized protein n=1 Tax=Lipingzhangella halophila TaxID=1783352 RepID=A0A7W7RKN1_9ACTN|nr:hypothetical protein [Lipingzhangella halophila]MBB4933753.1 hypothetical protein [Lipingzhangella halophila]